MGRMHIKCPAKAQQYATLLIAPLPPSSPYPSTLSHMLSSFPGCCYRKWMSKRNKLMTPHSKAIFVFFFSFSLSLKFCKLISLSSNQSAHQLGCLLISISINDEEKVTAVLAFIFYLNFDFSLPFISLINFLIHFRFVLFFQG